MPAATVTDTFFLKIDEVQTHPFSQAIKEIPLLNFELNGSISVDSVKLGSGSGNGKVQFEPAKVRMKLMPEMNVIWNSLMATGQIGKSLVIITYNGKKIRSQVHFENVKISQVKTSFESLMIVDEITFSYTKIKWLVGAKTFGWDLGLNTVL